MDNIVTITLGRGRTKQDAFRDAAIKNGWTPTITETLTGVHSFEYAALQKFGTAEGVLNDSGIEFKEVSSAFNPQNATPDAPVTITYTYEKTSDNPVSDQVFGARVWAKICDTLDTEAQLESMKIQKGWEGYNPTVVA